MHRMSQQYMSILAPLDSSKYPGLQKINEYFLALQKTEIFKYWAQPPWFSPNRFDLGTPVFLGLVGSFLHMTGGAFYLWSVCTPLCGGEKMWVLTIGSIKMDAASRSENGASAQVSYMCIPSDSQQMAERWLKKGFESYRCLWAQSQILGHSEYKNYVFFVSLCHNVFQNVGLFVFNKAHTQWLTTAPLHQIPDGNSRNTHLWTSATNRWCHRSHVCLWCCL